MTSTIRQKISTFVWCKAKGVAVERLNQGPGFRCRVGLEFMVEVLARGGLVITGGSEA